MQPDSMHTILGLTAVFACSAVNGKVHLLRQPHAVDVEVNKPRSRPLPLPACGMAITLLTEYAHDA